MYTIKRIDNCLDIIEKMFYGEYENIIIIDIDSREIHSANSLPVIELKKRTIDMLDGIVIEENKIYIKFNY